MFLNQNVAIDINSEYIKIMIGNRRRAKSAYMTKTPEGSVADGRLVDIDSVYNSIIGLVGAKKLKGKNGLFSIHGQDIVTRHIELPVLDKKNIKASAEWEINQYLPDGGTNYYIDFQIEEKVDDGDKKSLKLLVVAVKRDKIDEYDALANKVGLKLHTIDTAANCTARFLGGNRSSKNIAENVGVINIGESSSSIIIMDKGNLYLEREVPFGEENVVREITRRYDVIPEEAIQHLKNKFDFMNISEASEVDSRIQTLFDNVFSSFVKVVQFATTGKINKNLDNIYIIGSGSEIKGIDKYVQGFFASPALNLSTETMPVKFKLPKECDVKLYANTIGLLLRKG